MARCRIERCLARDSFRNSFSDLMLNSSPPKGGYRARAARTAGRGRDAAGRSRTIRGDELKNARWRESLRAGDEHRGQRSLDAADYSGRDTVDNPVDWFRPVLIPSPSDRTVNPPTRVLGFAGRPNALSARPVPAGGRLLFPKRQNPMAVRKTKAGQAGGPAIS